jgi:hypothetical protein
MVTDGAASAKLNTCNMLVVRPEQQAGTYQRIQQPRTPVNSDSHQPRVSCDCQLELNFFFLLFPSSNDKLIKGTAFHQFFSLLYKKK